MDPAFERSALRRIVNPRKQRRRLFDLTAGLHAGRAIERRARGFQPILDGFVEDLRFLYDYAWFVGFGVAFAVYALIMKKNQR